MHKDRNTRSFECHLTLIFSINCICYYYIFHLLHIYHLFVDWKRNYPPVTVFRPTVSLALWSVILDSIFYRLSIITTHNLSTYVPSFLVIIPHVIYVPPKLDKMVRQSKFVPKAKAKKTPVATPAATDEVAPGSKLYSYLKFLSLIFVFGSEYCLLTILSVLHLCLQNIQRRKVPQLLLA